MSAGVSPPVDVAGQPAIGPASRSGGAIARRALALASSLAVVVTSSMHLETVFASDTAQLLVIGAAVTGLAVSAGMGRIGLRGAPLVFAHLLLFLLATSLLLPDDQLGPSSIGTAWRATTAGWNDLLRLPIPADATTHLVAPVAMVSWAVMALETEIVLRSRRPATGLIPLAVFAGGFVLLATGPRHRYDLGLVIAAAALVHVWATGHGLSDGPVMRDGQARSVGAIVAGVVVAVAALALGLGVAVARNDEERFDPRVGLAPPIELLTEASPLTDLKRQLTTPAPEELFTIELDGAMAPGEPLYLRLAALEDYDGALWGSTRTYPVTGPLLDDVDVIGSLGAERRPVVTIEVTTTGSYDGQYLPVIGDPVRIDAAGIGYSARTGTLVSREPATRVEFSLRTTPPVVSGEDDAASVASATAATTASDDELLSLPVEVPVGFQATLDVLTEPPGTGARLRQLEEVLTAETFGYSEQAPSGHSVAALERYLGIGEPSGSIRFEPGVGYAEQAAALFAVLARLDGYPTRLAVGYRLAGPDGSGSDVPLVVSEADAWAWVEVELDGLGWVVFDPTPEAEREVRPPEAPTVAERADLPAPELAEPGQGDGGGAEPAPGAAPAAGASPLAWWHLALVAALLLFLTPYGLKRLRRRRRLRSDVPARVVLGRWRELRDRLRDVGLPVGLSFTPRQTVGLAVERQLVAGVSAAASLARLADLALYQPELVTGDEVELAAQFERLGHKEMAAEVSWWRRVGAVLRPRSLLPVGLVEITTPPVHPEIAGL